MSSTSSSSLTLVDICVEKRVGQISRVESSSLKLTPIVFQCKITDHLSSQGSSTQNTCLACFSRLILISKLLQIYQSKSEIISSHTNITIYPLTLENTNTKFYIINLQDFFNDSKVRHRSYTGIVIMYSSKVLRFNP